MKNVLVIAPHNDDEVLGCGGVMAKYANNGHQVYVCEITKGNNFDLLKQEAKKAHKVLGVKKSYFLEFPVNELRNIKQSLLNDKIKKIIDEVDPQVVFIPHIGDMHSDHDEVAKAAMVALRPISSRVKKIYAYETLSETGWSRQTSENVFSPNVFVDITNYIHLKLKAMESFQSQLQNYPNPRSLEAIEALSKYRGSLVCKKNVESFMLIREIIGDEDL